MAMTIPHPHSGDHHLPTHTLAVVLGVVALAAASLTIWQVTSDSAPAAILPEIVVPDVFDGSGAAGTAEAQRQAIDSATLSVAPPASATSAGSGLGHPGTVPDRTGGGHPGAGIAPATGTGPSAGLGHPGTIPERPAGGHPALLP